MRTPSVDGIKNGSDRTLDLPRQGTYTRTVYDALKANRGLPTDLPNCVVGEKVTSSRSFAVNYLRDFFGCDIRLLKKSTGTYILVGEWYGSHYADYVLERIKERDG